MHPFDGSSSPPGALDLHLLLNLSPDRSSGSGCNSPNGCDSPSMAALHRFLPSNNEDSWSPEHLYACDEFRMFEFKVRRCMRGRSHDWTECPFAHPGEKARRRDPRRFLYSGTACPDFRKGCCKSGDACELAHGVFECWLHPARYRTQPCKDGRGCKRKVCFFAHTPQQLRVPPTVPPMSSDSPPASPRGPVRYAARQLERTATMPHGADGGDRRRALLGQSLSFNGRPSVSALMVALQRQMELSGGEYSSAGFSPAAAAAGGFSYVSPPVSPYARSPLFRSEQHLGLEDFQQPRVESGRDLRAKIYGKIMRENLVECGGADAPDLAWVNELVAIN